MGSDVAFLVSKPCFGWPETYWNVSNTGQTPFHKQDFLLSEIGPLCGNRPNLADEEA
jgi:hypothetical protein